VFVAAVDAWRPAVNLLRQRLGAAAGRTPR
jgi:hypothetical protein